MFPREKRQCLTWVADQLREALDLRPEARPGRGELAVTFADDPEKQPEPGILTSSPGRILVRHAFLVDTRFEFYRLGTLDRRAFPALLSKKAFALEPEDMRCTADAQGSGCLEINRSLWPTVQLTIWCEDKEALRHVLGQFLSTATQKKGSELPI